MRPDVILVVVGEFKAGRAGVLGEGCGIWDFGSAMGAGGGCGRGVLLSDDGLVVGVEFGIIACEICAGDGGASVTCGCATAGPGDDRGIVFVITDEAGG